MSSLYEEAKENLSSRGGRMTAERRLILEALDCAGDHPTAEELYEQIKPHHPDLNLSTVYRTLRWLEGQRLVGSHRFADDRRQDRFDPAASGEHYHFICTECKQVFEFDDPSIVEIKRRIEQNYGVRVDSASLVLNGLCLECQEKE